MGQKVNPISFRLGVNHTWNSRWFVSKVDYSKFLARDLRIRDIVIQHFPSGVVSDIFIEKMPKKLVITIRSSRASMLLGKKGSQIESLHKKLLPVVSFYAPGDDISISVIEISTPDLDVVAISAGIARQLEKRASFRRVMKRAMQLAVKAGARGIKIICSGRLGGADIARSEKVSYGSVPLHTLRADINYSESVAKTAYGTIGVKVWVYFSDVSSYNPSAYDRRLS
ncbi:30S ribosomal protein S3 [Candidatus Gromoviella agglomerans]|uniref:30S ribosomal protein S3 n=1 Tax=Candidatus Gromoviella agglomerans TaxID=2806609 RepID=UPI001E4FA363|nr:30S ribosomal protein S3 [Candidatus Gromoviella agglomerans]UFX98565.1 30S ribosomal protein S3 [Candidatus Gromoviella agglomerans]